jgi:uncharacterized Rossmann fold enzyme
MARSKRHKEITAKPAIDLDEDKEASRLLNSLLPGKEKAEDTILLRRTLIGKYVFVCGSGPTLEADIKALKEAYLHKEKRHVFIAANGSGKALFEAGILPEIEVSDLDRFPESVLANNRKGTITLVNAKADNTELREFVPKLKNPIGTTCGEAFGKLHNFGGSTEMDRCVYLAERFQAGIIILAGMDYEEGTARELIEELARKTNVSILDITSSEDLLANVPKVSARHLRTI